MQIVRLTAQREALPQSNIGSVRRANVDTLCRQMCGIAALRRLSAKAERHLSLVAHAQKRRVNSNSGTTPLLACQREDDKGARVRPNFDFC